MTASYKFILEDVSENGFLKNYGFCEMMHGQLDSKSLSYSNVLKRLLKISS